MARQVRRLNENPCAVSADVVINLCLQGTIFGLSGKHLFLVSQVQAIMGAKNGRAGAYPTPAIFLVITRVKAGNI